MDCIIIIIIIIIVIIIIINDKVLMSSIPTLSEKKYCPKQTNLAWAPRVLLDEGMLSLKYFKIWFLRQTCVSFHGYPSKFPTNKWNTGIYKLSKSYSLSPNNAWFIRLIRSLFAGCFHKFLLLWFLHDIRIWLGMMSSNGHVQVSGPRPHEIRENNVYIGLPHDTRIISGTRVHPTHRLPLYMYTVIYHRYPQIMIKRNIDTMIHMLFCRHLFVYWIQK